MTSGGLITTSGKTIMLDRTYNGSPTRSEVTVFKVGTGTTATTLSDTDLETPAPISGEDIVDDCETADWTDSANMTTTLNTTTFKTSVSSINLTKDAGASAEAETHKTTTSVNFTTSPEFSIWIYVIDATALAKLAVTDAIVIRFGTDNSNYYEWKKDNADLVAGQWNLLDGLTAANGTEVGTVTPATMEYTEIEMTALSSATVWSDGDFMMDDIKIIATADYTKTFELGYPTLDYNTLQATIRTRLSTVNSNGYAITEFGVFNTDGTALMESRDIFTAISKSSDDELIFIAKTTID